MRQNIPIIDPSSYAELPSGLIVPKAFAPERRPIGVDLFAGCGGFSLGMIQGGFEVVAACDNDPNAALTYLLNLGTYPVQVHYLSEDDKERLNKACEKGFGLSKKKPENGVYEMPVSGSARPPDRPGVGHFFFGDVRKLTGKMVLDALGLERGEVDCVFGGPPCQGFSTSGKRDVMDPRNSLVFEFARLILEIWPKTMMMENVPGIVSMKTPEGLPVVDAFAQILADGNFGTFDALRRSLGGDPSRKAAYRGKSKKEKKKQKKEQQRQQKQAALF